MFSGQNQNKPTNPSNQPTKQNPQKKPTKQQNKTAHIYFNQKTLYELIECSVRVTKSYYHNEKY